MSHTTCLHVYSVSFLALDSRQHMSAFATRQSGEECEAIPSSLLACRYAGKVRRYKEECRHEERLVDDVEAHYRSGRIGFVQGRFVEPCSRSTVGDGSVVKDDEDGETGAEIVQGVRSRHRYR